MSVFGGVQEFETAQRMAKVLCCSAIVPLQFQGEKNLPNCIVALEMANRIGASPLMVMQNLYVVHGNPSWSAKFLIACLNSCGRFTPLRYEFSGEKNTDSWSCRAKATDKETGEELVGSWVSIEMAKKEGWYGKAGSKWQTMPELMLQYRASAFFQRTYAPEISMGMLTSEEQEDISIQQEKPIDVEAVEVIDENKVIKAVLKCNSVEEAESLISMNDMADSERCKQALSKLKEKLNIKEDGETETK